MKKKYNIIYIKSSKNVLQERFTSEKNFGSIIIITIITRSEGGGFFKDN